MFAEVLSGLCVQRVKAGVCLCQHELIDNAIWEKTCLRARISIITRRGVAGSYLGGLSLAQPEWKSGAAPGKDCCLSFTTEARYMGSSRTLPEMKCK